MSADWWLEAAPGGDACETYAEFNLTYNMNAMLWEAGWRWGDGGAPQTSFPNSAVWSKEALAGIRAGELGEKVAYVVSNLKADPEKYRAMNPPNGWGNYDDTLATFELFLDAIERWPDAVVGVWF